MAKVEATRSYGADIELTGPALESALEAAQATVGGTRRDASSTRSRTSS